MKRFKIPAIEIFFASIIIMIAISFELLELAQGIEIIILLGLVFVTAEYARSTQKMAEEMKLTREMQNMHPLLLILITHKARL